MVPTVTRFKSVVFFCGVTERFYKTQPESIEVLSFFVYPISVQLIYNFRKTWGYGKKRNMLCSIKKYIITWFFPFLLDRHILEKRTLEEFWNNLIHANYLILNNIHFLIICFIFTDMVKVLINVDYYTFFPFKKLYSFLTIIFLIICFIFTVIVKLLINVYVYNFFTFQYLVFVSSCIIQYLSHILLQYINKKFIN